MCSSMTPQERKQEIAKAKKLALDSNRRVMELKAGCDHALVEESCDSLRCAVCQKYFGWYCPESPDKTCHYFTNENGLIELMNRELVRPGKEWPGKKFESDDFCVFCGHPDERK